MSRPTVIISPSILVRMVYDLPDGLARLGWEVRRFRPGSPLGSATNCRRADLCLTPSTQGPGPHVGNRYYHLRCGVSIGPKSGHVEAGSVPTQRLRTRLDHDPGPAPSGVAMTA